MHQTALLQLRWITPVKNMTYSSPRIILGKYNCNPNSASFLSNVCIRNGLDGRWNSSKALPFAMTVLRFRKEIHSVWHQISRSVFSDIYLGMDNFQHRRNSCRLQLGNVENLRSRISADFEKSGLKNIFSDDVRTLIDIAENEDDLKQLSNILKASLKDDFRTFPHMSNLLHMFWSVCKITGNVECARDMWTEGGIKPHIRSGMRKRYYMLLYDKGQYQEIVDDVMQDMDVISIDHLTIAVAALGKIGTRDALSKLSTIINDSGRWADRKHSGNSRAIYIYAWLAFQLQEYGLAYDILTDKFRIGRPAFLGSNIKLALLVEVGRLEEALLLIRSEILVVNFTPYRKASEQKELTKAKDNCKNDNGFDDVNNSEHLQTPANVSKAKGPAVCFDIMKKLSVAVKNEQNAELSRELTLVCQALDQRATLIEKPLEELVFEPIHFAKKKFPVLSNEIDAKRRTHKVRSSKNTYSE